MNMWAFYGEVSLSVGSIMFCLHVCGFAQQCEVSKDIFLPNIVRKSLTQISFDGGICNLRAYVSGLFQRSTGNWLLRGLRPIQLGRWNSPLVTFETQFDGLSSSSLLFRICYHVLHWKRGFTQDQMDLEYWNVTCWEGRMKSVYLIQPQTIQLDVTNVMWQQIWRKSVGKSLMPPKIYLPLEIH